MSEEEGKNRPKELRIREIKIGDKILITTFLCKKTTSAKIIKKLSSTLSPLSRKFFSSRVRKTPKIDR